MSIKPLFNLNHKAPATANKPPTLTKLPLSIGEAHFSKTFASGLGEEPAIAQKKFFQLLKEKYLAEPFLDEVEKDLQTKAHFSFQTSEEVLTPNQAALEQWASHYYEKYGIVIQVVEPGELKEKVSKWHEEVKEPTYFGVITRSTRRTSTLDEGHVTPILLYLPGNSDITEVEAVIMDTIGEGVPFEYILLSLGICETNLFSTIKVRQATQRSCRVGALALLRNALLDLKHKQVTGGFSAILNEEARFSEEQGFTFAARALDYLPPQWDYTEQASNPLLKAHHLAIHTCFNSKKTPISAQEHRKKYQKRCSFDYKVWVDQSPRHIHSPAPEGISYKGDTFWSIQFSLNREINTYLFRKSKKIAQFCEMQLKNPPKKQFAFLKNLNILKKVS